MKPALITIVSFLIPLSAFALTVPAKEGQDIKAFDEDEERDALSTAVEQWQEQSRQAPRINLDDPSSTDLGDPPPPPFDLGRGGDGRGGSRVVFFVSPPLENGEHEIVVPLTRLDGEKWGGVNNIFLDYDVRDEQGPGIRIDDAAFIEGPENHPVGCVFMAALTGTDTIPRPIFYGEFFQKPVPRVTSILCSSDIHERYKDADRYRIGDTSEDN